MKKTTKTLLAGLLAVPALALGVAALSPTQTAYAEVTQTCSTETLNVTTGSDCAKGDSVPATLFGSGSVFTKIVNVLLFVIGAIAVIMLIIGGIRYVVSGGDAAAVTAAKNTILYAVIGIVVAILAFAIVNFVINGVGGATA